MVRIKNRYMVVEVTPNDQKIVCEHKLFKLHHNAVSQSIQNKVQQLHGDFGAAAIRHGFQAKYVNELTRIAILRCRHGPHKLVTSVIPFINSIDSQKVAVNILYIGATMKKCFTFIKLYQEQKCDEFCAKIDSEEEKQSLRMVLLNFEAILKTLQNYDLFK